AGTLELLGVPACPAGDRFPSDAVERIAWMVIAQSCELGVGRTRAAAEIRAFQPCRQARRGCFGCGIGDAAQRKMHVCPGVPHAERKVGRYRDASEIDATAPRSEQPDLRLTHRSGGQVDADPPTRMR